MYSIYMFHIIYILRIHYTCIIYVLYSKYVLHILYSSYTPLEYRYPIVRYIQNWKPNMVLYAFMVRVFPICVYEKKHMPTTTKLKKKKPKAKTKFFWRNDLKICTASLLCCAVLCTFACTTSHINISEGDAEHVLRGIRTDTYNLYQMIA